MAKVVADAAVLPDASDRKVFVTGSGRCGECHEKMFDEWETSAHAKAVSSDIYKAAVASAKDPTCEKCHAPLAAVAPREATVSEGVTCDVCHTLRDPKPDVGGGTFTLAVDDMVKYGPRCNLKDHYFHRMGCSPEHRTAEICGACHWWERKGIPVFTEYADWKAGPKNDKPCQSCHMPKDRAALATGSPVRNGVPNHGLLGRANKLRESSVAMEITAAAEGDITVKLTSVHAGHPIPAGLPERRIVVRADLHDASGASLWHGEQALGRKLVDATGAETPFWSATKVAEDTRIPIDGSQTVAFQPGVSGAASLDVTVVYRELSDAVAKQLAITEVQEQPMTKASMKLGKGPKTMTVRPK